MELTFISLTQSVWCENDSSYVYYPRLTSIYVSREHELFENWLHVSRASGLDYEKVFR
jgi:hypothetical protein